MTDEAQFNPWRLIREEEKYDCSHFAARADIVSHSGGKPRPYNSVRMKHHGVYIIPIDDEGYTTLVGQYRYVLGRFTWEACAGGALKGAVALETAKVELSEETGLRARHWLKLVEGSVSPGTTDEVTPGFVAWGLQKGEPHPEPEEHLSLRRLPFNEAVTLVLNGEVDNVITAALVLAIQVKFSRGELPADLHDLLKRGPRTAAQRP
jgi:8-oxo-dGTP pyrophosphatase MutT (NUDIX family)